MTIKFSIGDFISDRENSDIEYTDFKIVTYTIFVAYFYQYATPIFGNPSVKFIIPKENYESALIDYYIDGNVPL